MYFCRSKTNSTSRKKSRTQDSRQRLVIMVFPYFLSQIGDWLRVQGFPLKWFSLCAGFAFFFFFYQKDLWEDCCGKLSVGWACCLSPRAAGTSSQSRTHGHGNGSSFDCEIKPGSTVMSSSFLHSCWIILCNSLLAIFRCDTWTLFVKTMRQTRGQGHQSHPMRQSLVSGVTPPSPLSSHCKC